MIDTHLHLWELDAGWYGWNTPDLGDVHADSSLVDVAADQEQVGVTSSVVVQAADTLAETDWLINLAEREPRIGGVVGYLPLDDSARLEGLLATYDDAPLVGVRQLWHDHAHPEELAAAGVVRGLRQVGEAGLPVDVPDAFPLLWPALTAAASEAPKTTFVLDHAGKPPFGDPAAWSLWEDCFRDLAGRANVVVKLSGLFGGSGSALPASGPELARVVALTREVAGSDRTMIGSDWPMTRGELGYAASLTRLDALLAGWSAVERERALSGTAQATYGLAGR